MSRNKNSYCKIQINKANGILFILLTNQQIKVILILLINQQYYIHKERK